MENPTCHVEGFRKAVCIKMEPRHYGWERIPNSPLDMNVERTRRLHPALKALELPKAGYHAFRHFNVSLMDALRVPLKTIQERIGHSLTGSFTLDVYGHALDWKANEQAASALATELAKAVAKAQAENASLADSECLTAVSATQKVKDSQSLKLEVFANQ